MPELAGRHPAEEGGDLRHPADVGYQGDTSTGPAMPNAHLEVLPQGAAGHSIEGTDDQDDPYVSRARRAFDGGQQHVPVFLSTELACGLESHDSVRQIGQLSDHPRLLTWCPCTGTS